MAAAGGRGSDAIIPVLDFGEYMRTKSPQALEELSEKLRETSETVGFYFLKGAEGAQKAVGKLQEVNKRLHKLPLETLRNIGTDEDRSKFGNGYVFGGTDGRKEQGDDSFEAQEVFSGYNERNTRSQGSSRILSINAGHGRSAHDFPARVFPSFEDLPDFFPVADEFLAEMKALREAMIPVYAKALHMPDAADLAAAFQDPGTFVNLTYYPPRPVHLPEQNGIPIHADCSFVTFVKLDGNPGLQVMTQAGEWVMVPTPPPGCFLVNTGEFLTRMTNGKFVNAVHKVIPPVDKEKHSIVLFLMPDKTSPLAPLPQFCTMENPAAWESFTFRSFMKSGENPMQVGARELEKRRKAREAAGLPPARSSAL